MPKEELVKKLIDNLETLSTELTMDSTLGKDSALLAETLLTAMSILLEQREEACTSQATSNIIHKLDLEIEETKNKLKSFETFRDMIKKGKLNHIFVLEYHHLPNHISAEKKLRSALNEYKLSNPIRVK